MLKKQEQSIVIKRKALYPGSKGKTSKGSSLEERRALSSMDSQNGFLQRPQGETQKKENFKYKTALKKNMGTRAYGAGIRCQI